MSKDVNDLARAAKAYQRAATILIELLRNDVFFDPTRNEENMQAAERKYSETSNRLCEVLKARKEKK